MSKLWTIELAQLLNSDSHWYQWKKTTFLNKATKPSKKNQSLAKPNKNPKTTQELLKNLQKTMKQRGGMRIRHLGIVVEHAVAGMQQDPGLPFLDEGVVFELLSGVVHVEFRRGLLGVLGSKGGNPKREEKFQFWWNSTRFQSCPD